jgi:hypothetical protein
MRAAKSKEIVAKTAISYLPVIFTAGLDVVLAIVSVFILGGL